MKKAVVYIHGAGGNAAECEHYKPLFPGCDVSGFDYKAQKPWEAVIEFPQYFAGLFENYSSVIVIANSIGAFFAMHSLRDIPLEKAYFISPVVNMEKLISDMMLWAGVSEKELEEKGTIQTSFGEELSWEYLTWVRSHPVDWKTPTSVLYGSGDTLQSLETQKAFALASGARLTVMDGGEHWFHTAQQMVFLDEWICK